MALAVRLQAALKAALQARDAVAISALRSAVSAIANAEAVDAPGAGGPGAGAIEHARLGAGAADVARRPLSDADMLRVVQGEIDERTAAAAEYDRLGRPDHAARLRAEAVVLSTQLMGKG